MGFPLIVAVFVWSSLWPTPPAIAQASESEQRFSFPFGAQPKAQEIRNWLAQVPPASRRQAIAQFHAQIGQPYLNRIRRQPEYRAPGVRDDDTKEFVFKTTPQRDLKIFVDYPENWKAADDRPAIIFWHGGGFTQGDAGQFFHQADYFTRRGAVCFRPEYRLRDCDDALPVDAVEDGISALRWVKERAAESGIDPQRIAVGGGSAGGCMAAAVATANADRLAQLGFVGAGDNRKIDTSVSAMILYNPFLDFFEPTHPRQIEEECLLLGKDPEEYRDAMHAISAIENVRRDSPPNIILFGTRDAFYVSDLRWIVKCREVGAKCRDFVYQGEVHSWYNNSPHLEYTTQNVNQFLIDIGFLDREPEVELPSKTMSANRDQIQTEKYENKKDWDQIPQYQRFRREHNIQLIPYKPFEEDPAQPPNRLPARLVN